MAASLIGIVCLLIPLQGHWQKNWDFIWTIHIHYTDSPYDPREGNLESFS